MPNTLHPFLVPLHALLAMIWVGGMFFAYMALRPAAASQLEPPARLQLWVAVFKRFFPWVWAAVIVLLVTGWSMIGNFGGMKNTPIYVHIMNGLGTLMVLIYLHVFFAPFKRLQRAVAASDWSYGATQLNQIRVLVGVNLLIGLVVFAVATGGRFV